MPVTMFVDFTLLVSYILMKFFYDNKTLISGDTLEIAAQCAIVKNDIPAFERALAQLKPFYFDLE